jgi:hypothetical protein
MAKLFVNKKLGLVQEDNPIFSPQPYFFPDKQVLHGFIPWILGRSFQILLENVFPILYFINKA